MEIENLPPEHPHRFFTAQVILYIGVILLVAVLRAHGADQPPGAGPVVPASAFTEHLNTEYGREQNYQRDLAGLYEQTQEEGRNQEPPLTDGTDSIPIHLDGILCHALSALTLLFSVMP